MRGDMSRVIAIIALAVLIAGCSQVREELGLEKSSPDEFRVYSRAPLSVPPNFALRPPRPGVARPQEGTPQDQARQAIFRASTGGASVDEVIPNDGRSFAERSFLVSAGAGDAEPDIRRVIDRETNQINRDDEGLVDSLLFWKEDNPDGVVIDAAAESRRIQERTALGDDLTGEDVPTIERKETGLFEGIF